MTALGSDRAGRIIRVNPDDGTILDAAELESCPEGVVLTQNHICTSGAILDRSDLTVLLDNPSCGFTITSGPDGSIRGTGGGPAPRLLKVWLLVVGPRFRTWTDQLIERSSSCSRPRESARLCPSPGVF